MASKTMLVTGANRGLGFAFVERYVKEGFDGTIILGCRSLEKGAEAIKKLQADMNLSDDKSFLACVQLDITDADSRKKAIEQIKAEFGPLDILVNNAGTFFMMEDYDCNYEKLAQALFGINYEATRDLVLEVMKAGVIKKKGRILNCGSCTADAIYPHLTQEEKDVSNMDRLEVAIQAYLDRARTSPPEYRSDELLDKLEIVHGNCGRSAYAMSKVWLRKMTEIFSKDYSEYYHFVFCPGFCSTDLSNHMAKRTAYEGSYVAWWLGTSDEERITRNSGNYFTNDDQMFAWGEGPTLTSDMILERK